MPDDTGEKVAEADKQELGGLLKKSVVFTIKST